VGGGGADHLESRHGGEPVLRGVRMGGSHVGAAIGGAADDDGTIDQAAAHVADLAGVVDDLVVGHGGKTPEHQFHDRAQSQHGSAHAHANKGGFADGSVHHAFVAVFFPKTLGDL